MSETRVNGAIAVLRDWRNDGADGESAHLLCDEYEALRARLALAEAVVEAARKRLHSPCGSSAEFCEWCKAITALDAADKKGTER